MSTILDDLPGTNSNNNSNQFNQNQPQIGTLNAADSAELFRESKRQFSQLFDESSPYANIVQKEVIGKRVPRLIININHLRARLPEKAAAILQGSATDFGALEAALADHIASIDPIFAKDFEKFSVGFEGSFGSHHVNPRTLVSEFLGKMVCIEGIVTKCQNIHPKIVKSVHYCPATKKTFERYYSDVTSLDPFPSNVAYPTKDDAGNLLETEYGLSVYKDTQSFVLQELPEKAPLGQLPRSVEVIVDDDLVDKIKPGDRIITVGNYRCVPGKKNGFTNASFRTIVIGNNIKQLNQELNQTFNASDIQKIKEFVKENHKHIFQTISESIAPSICGHEYIKKAVLCMLVGGTEKLLANGTRLRGDINLMLMGDPSVAKSQFLRYVLNVAARAIATTGRGSSGVGLTAAVTSDPETGERRLEAGAMVLADRGVVCIDEFDKMLDADKTAIHEVMEQGRVTIAKAGIQAQLNARCSVLAAANPVWGKYNEYKTPMENIGMQDSLLSRFDLLFIVLDHANREDDLRISDHVLAVHKYRAPNSQDGTPLPLTNESEIYTTNVASAKGQEEGLQIYDKFNYIDEMNGKKRKILSVDFIKKYVQISKNLKPALSNQACKYITEEYSRLRSHEKEMSQNYSKTQPITPRALETLIRLATAHAKIRFSLEVSLQDAEFAVEILQYCLFKKVLDRPRRSKKSRKETSENEVDDESDFDGDDDFGKSDNEMDVDDDFEIENIAKVDEDDRDKSPLKKRAKQDSSDVRPVFARTSSIDAVLDDATAVTDAQYELAKQNMSLAFKKQNDPFCIKLVDFYAQIQSSGNLNLSQSQTNQVLERMENDNQIMVSNDTIYLI